MFYKQNIMEMEELSKKKLDLIMGGCFAFDAGWFLGNLVTGGFSSPAAIVESGVEYGIHYGSEHSH